MRATLFVSYDRHMPISHIIQRVKLKLFRIRLDDNWLLSEALSVNINQIAQMSKQRGREADTLVSNNEMIRTPPHTLTLQITILKLVILAEKWQPVPVHCHLESTVLNVKQQIITIQKSLSGHTNTTTTLATNFIYFINCLIIKLLLHQTLQQAVTNVLMCWILFMHHLSIFHLYLFIEALWLLDTFFQRSALAPRCLFHQLHISGERRYISLWE